MGKIRAFSKRRYWAPSEEQLLKDMYALTNRDELSRLFNGRSISSIETKAFLLGLSKPVKVKRDIDTIRKSKRDFMAKKRAENPEKVRQYQLDNYFANHEARKETTRNYIRKRFFWSKAMKLRGKDRANYKDLASLWKKQKGKCALTGRKLNRSAQLDHILPKAKGGGDRKENLRWLCTEANILKRDMLDSEMIALCLEILKYKEVIK